MPFFILLFVPLIAVLVLVVLRNTPECELRTYSIEERVERHCRLSQPISGNLFQSDIRLHSHRVITTPNIISDKSVPHGLGQIRFPPHQKYPSITMELGRSSCQSAPGFVARIRDKSREEPTGTYTN